MKTAETSKKDSSRVAAVKAALEAQNNIDKTREFLEITQKEMEKLMGKKPKNA